MPDPPGSLLGIALYLQLDACGTFYHWALVAHSSSYEDANVHVCQIKNCDDSGHPVPWHALHTNSTALELSINFIGIVHVGKLDMDVAQLVEFIGEHPADRDGYSSGGLNWTCATYVLRALDYLQQCDLVRLPYNDNNILYMEITDKGTELQRMKASGKFGPVPVVQLRRP